MSLRCSDTAKAPGLGIAWDDAGSASNNRKHGASFEEAQTVLYDDWTIVIEDDDASDSRSASFVSE